MTRIFVQRGAGGSSSNSGRSGSQAQQQQQQQQQQNQPASAAREEELTLQLQPPEPLPSNDITEHLLEGDESSSNKPSRLVDPVSESSSCAEDRSEREKPPKDDPNVSDPAFLVELSGLQFSDQSEQVNSVQLGTGSPQMAGAASHPPPPPVPPPKPSSSSNNGLRRVGSGSSNSVRIGSSRRPVAWPPVAARTSATGSRPSSPRSLADCEGYNSADEQGPCYTSNYDDSEREHMFEHDLRRVKGFEIKKMAADGNCLFRAVADQVYGDPEAYDMARQMCVDYMERERDHFSQFMTEGFMSYCKRKRRDKVYGNNIELQAFAEMYNRPIHIYSYSTEPINIFQGNYDTDVPPVRLSYHHGNHYNSVVDPRRLTVGAGLGFSSLRGTNSVDRDQVKAAIKAQQDQQIENALLAEGRLYSDLELTEKEIERMVMEASRAEFLNQQQVNFREQSRSAAEPSSSAAISGSSGSAAAAVPDKGSENCVVLPDAVLTSSMQLLLAMGFGYIQVMEAYSIFGEDVDSMICYLVEMGGAGASADGSNRRKGKAAE